MIRTSTRRPTSLIALAAALALAAGTASYAIAQHSGHGTHGASAGDKAPSSIAFAAANAKMHEAMSIKFSGDADVDFVRGMIPHHQGAVEMAKIVLLYGKDPVLQKLATEIVTAQESEIAPMNAWLAKKGG